LDSERNYPATGQQERAVQEMETAAQIAHVPVVLMYLGYVYASSGRILEAQKAIDELEELSQTAYVPASSFAGIYVALGEIDNAIEWLEKSFEQGHSLLAVHFTLPPFFDPLRSHPRFHALLRKMNLEA